MLIQYYHFTRWANNLVIDALNDLKRIDKADYLLSHILNSHRIWNARALREDAGVLAFDSVGRSMWDAVDQENYHKTLSILGEFKLTSAISYENSKGEAFEASVQDIFLHLANHSTHHRGQLGSLIRKANFKPPVTDYIAWVRAGKPLPQ